MALLPVTSFLNGAILIELVTDDATGDAVGVQGVNTLTVPAQVTGTDTQTGKSRSLIIPAGQTVNVTLSRRVARVITADGDTYPTLQITCQAGPFPRCP